MKVLVIGDEHTYGYGLSGGKLSYLGHFIRQISQAGQDVSVEAYAHLTWAQLSSTLTLLPLSRYDLIILQFDHRLFNPTNLTSPNAQPIKMPMLPELLPLAGRSNRPRSVVRQQIKMIGMAFLRMLWPAYGLKGIAALLKQLRPYRHNVLVVTPLPHRNWLNQWFRQQTRNVLLNEADKQLFSVFDSDSVIRPREEYFLPNDPKHLSAVSHELLGRMLFDFYQSAPTIITIQSIRREQN